MKNILIILGLVSFIFMITFSSCKKEEEYVPEEMPTVTIKGKVKAELVDTGTVMEMAPKDTKIIAKIDAEDLVTNPNNNYDYKKITYEGTVNSNGEYSIKIDATEKDVNVTLTPVDFEYDQLVWDNYPNTTKTERKVYTANPIQVTVFKNTTKIIDITYN